MKFFLLNAFIFLDLVAYTQMTIKYTNTAATAITFETGGSPTACGAGKFSLKGGATSSGSCITMTPANLTDNFGAAWVCTSINLDSSFLLKTSVTFGANIKSGDGIVFALKQDASPNKYGGIGGNIGYHNPGPSGVPIGTSLGVEFDTFLTGPGDSGTPSDSCDHAQIVRNGDLTSKVGGQTCLKSTGLSVNDGLAHNICIMWDAANNIFSAYFDDRLVASTGDIRGYFPINATYPLGYKGVYWGFTAGDGVATNLNNHVICNTSMVVSNVTRPAPFCVAAVMPVEMGSFEVSSLDEKTNRISWETFSERNNSFFTIEKSVNGTDFDILTTIDGAGNSNEIRAYDFVDYYVGNESFYYRLMQTDIDGQKTLLAVDYIENEFANYSEVTRNPFEKNCKLNVKSNINSKKNIVVSESNGKIIYTDQLDVVKGTNEFEIDFSSYQNGVYFIQIVDANNMESLKVIKLNN
ncbi:MAG: lectin-like domain-containing protein [Flavobacteriia bacterium]|jgi:hypothetical protein